MFSGTVFLTRCVCRANNSYLCSVGSFPGSPYTIHGTLHVETKFNQRHVTAKY